MWDSQSPTSLCSQEQRAASTTMASDTSMVAMPKLLVDGFTALTFSHTIAWAFHPTPPSPHDLMLQSLLPYWGHGCLCCRGAQRVFDCIDKGNGIFYRRGWKCMQLQGVPQCAQALQHPQQMLKDYALRFCSVAGAAFRLVFLWALYLYTSRAPSSCGFLVSQDCAA
jgi:hypothetical protein